MSNDQDNAGKTAHPGGQSGARAQTGRAKGDGSYASHDDEATDGKGQSNRSDRGTSPGGAGQKQRPGAAGKSDGSGKTDEGNTGVSGETGGTDDEVSGAAI